MTDHHTHEPHDHIRHETCGHTHDQHHGHTNFLHEGHLHHLKIRVRLELIQFSAQRNLENRQLI